MDKQTENCGGNNLPAVETPEQKLERLTRQMVLFELNHRRILNQQPPFPEVPEVWWQKHGAGALARARSMKVVTIISIWSTLAKPGPPVEYDVLADDGDPHTTLEHAYAVTNLDGRPMSRHAATTTTGDIMRADGNYYLVEPRGFHELTESEAQAIKQLHPLDTCWGYERIAQNHKI